MSVSEQRKVLGLDEEVLKDLNTQGQTHAAMRLEDLAVADSDGGT